MTLPPQVGAVSRSFVPAHAGASANGVAASQGSTGPAAPGTSGPTVTYVCAIGMFECASGPNKWCCRDGQLCGSTPGVCI